MGGTCNLLPRRMNEQGHRVTYGELETWHTFMLHYTFVLQTRLCTSVSNDMAQSVWVRFVLNRIQKILFPKC